MKPTVLIVGAGAVGQVYAYHLHRGGADVHFLVKDKYRADLEKGLTLYALRKDRRRRHPIRFAPPDYKTHTSLLELAPGEITQIYLTFASTALRSFDLAGLRTRFPAAVSTARSTRLRGPNLRVRWPRIAAAPPVRRSSPLGSS